MMNDLLTQVVEMLAPAIATLILALLAVVAAYLRKLAAQVEYDVARKSLDSAIAEAHLAAATAVRETQQVLVDEWRRAAEDGKLTPEEKAEALRAAKNAFLRVMSERSLDILKAAWGPIEQWLDDLLEAQVQAVKAERDPVQARVQAAASPKS